MRVARLAAGHAFVTLLSHYRASGPSRVRNPKCTRMNMYHYIMTSCWYDCIGPKGPGAKGRRGKASRLAPSRLACDSRARVVQNVGRGVYIIFLNLVQFHWPGKTLVVPEILGGCRHPPPPARPAQKGPSSRLASRVLTTRAGAYVKNSFIKCMGRVGGGFEGIIYSTFLFFRISKNIL